MKYDIILSGVGGQGVLSVGAIIALGAMKAGYFVKQSEVHGMSQRGGSVNSHVRWGATVRSPVIGRGEVDVLVALEKLEALRYITMLRPGGTVLVGEFRIPPLSVSSGGDHYPTDQEIRDSIANVTQDFYFVPTLTLAGEAGNTRAHNVVLLGALSVHTDHVSPEIWRTVIEQRVPPKTIELNRRAFEAGRQANQTAA